MRMFSGDLDQLVTAHAEIFRPEGHDLHEPDRARVRNRVAIEAALDVDDGHDQAGRNAHSPGRFASQNTFLRIAMRSSRSGTRLRSRGSIILYQTAES